MSIALSKRVAASLLKRGVRSIRIIRGAEAEAAKAITREDVRKMIKEKRIFAQEEKDNMSLYSKMLKKKRAQGRRRGSGRKSGTRKARQGVVYKQKIRGQRRLLASLKDDKTIDNLTFKELYRLVRGGTFPSKATLLNHIKTRGITITDEKSDKLKHI